MRWSKQRERASSLALRDRVECHQALKTQPNNVTIGSDVGEQRAVNLTLIKKIS